MSDAEAISAPETLSPRAWTAEILRACGQVLFADNAVTGACLLFGTALYSARAGVFALLGAVLCHTLAKFLPARDTTSGIRALHGANGMLLGVFWSWCFQFSTPSLALLALAAAATSVLHLGLSRLFVRAWLPVLSLPANLAFLAALLGVRHLSLSGMLPPEGVFLPAGTAATALFALLPEASDGLIRLARDYALPSWAAILVGAAACSGPLLRASVLGIGLGIGLALLAAHMPVLLPVGAPQGAAIFVGFNALPLALALHGFFFPAGLRSLVLCGAGTVFCAACWLALERLLGPLGLPFLTLPFVLSLHAVLSAERLRHWLNARATDTAHSGSGARPLRLQPAPAQPETGDAELESLLALLRQAKRVSLLSGAGTSTESGIPDIRGRSPFWREFPPQVFHLPSLLFDETTRVRFREMDRRFQALVLAAAPSGVHRAVRRLAELGRLSCVATQNVDGLFQRAGVPAEFVRELHGTVFSLRCLSCGLVHPRPDSLALPACPVCGGFSMADMVLMGEAVDRRILDEVLFRVCSSDLLIVAGTSLSVDPAASICTLAAQRGVPVVILNLDPTPQDYLASLVLRRPAGALLLHALGRLDAELAGRARGTRLPQQDGRGCADVP